MHVANAFIYAAFEIINLLLNFYVWVLVVGAIMSWLVAFDIINRRHRLVQMIGDFVFRLTEPVLAPIRRFIPPIGGLDLSPLALIFIIMFLRSFMMHLVMG